MKRAALFLLLAAANAGCDAPDRDGSNTASANESGIDWREACPELAALSARDPVADARAALARDDRRVLLIGGLVGEFPGVPAAALTDEVRDSSVMLPGTSDTDEGCPLMGGIEAARNYARRYNETIVARPGRRAP